MIGLVWKPIAGLLAAALLIVSVTMGIGWWMAASDRDTAIAERDKQKALADNFQSAIREQNRATDVLAEQKSAADARGAAAQQIAAANGRRLDAALARSNGVHATTCAEAMPYVNDILGAIK